ncbi:hypothetical protein [uncultured Sphingomonas sp.]|uniref:hypothetical protein n=1 Tax=uncultured Sphingomonas sp. TaxID=158754 RepID=UPI0030D897B3
MGRKVRIDMTGLRFGRLIGVAFAGVSRGGKAQWLFACDCGNEVVADGGNVRSGSTASCGCLHREICAARLITHGRRAAKRHDPTYRAWQEMNTVCANTASPRHRDFGGRGVTVSARWVADFARFLADMGERPDGTILMRRDTDEGFTPANCIWAPVRTRSDRAAAGHRRSLSRPLIPMPVALAG